MFVVLFFRYLINLRGKMDRMIDIKTVHRLGPPNDHSTETRIYRIDLVACAVRILNSSTPLAQIPLPSLGL